MSLLKVNFCNSYKARICLPCLISKFSTEGWGTRSCWECWGVRFSKFQSGDCITVSVSIAGVERQLCGLVGVTKGDILAGVIDWLRSGFSISIGVVGRCWEGLCMIGASLSIPSTESWLLCWVLDWDNWLLDDCEGLLCWVLGSEGWFCWNDCWEIGREGWFCWDDCWRFCWDVNRTSSSTSSPSVDERPETRLLLLNPFILPVPPAPLPLARFAPLAPLAPLETKIKV